MYNVEVKTTEKDGNTYVNTKLKSPVPMMKGMAAQDALIPAISINFDDEDLLESKEELGGACKYDLLRISDLRKIVLAQDYEGSAIQKAVQEREDEDELIKKAKEIAKAVIENDKELQEALAILEGRGVVAEDKPAAKPVAKAVKPKKEDKPPVNFDDEDLDVPF
jgi:hypothetical protein